MSLRILTIGLTVLYTYRRDGADRTRPAVVTDVGTADRYTSSSGPERKRETAPCVRLVVFDEAGSRGIDCPVFEDTEASAAGTPPRMGHWAWPARVEPAHVAVAAAAAAPSKAAKARR